MVNYIITADFINEYINETYNEKDFYYWINDKSGYSCFIKRHEQCGYLCGYVEIPKDHYLSKVKYSNIELEYSFEVHGGITYSDAMFSDKWCIGFDCAGVEDMKPFESYERGIYRNVEYVTQECEKLALQLYEFNQKRKSYIPIGFLSNPIYEHYKNIQKLLELNIIQENEIEIKSIFENLLKIALKLSSSNDPTKEK